MNKTLVYFAASPWKGKTQREQHIYNYLSEYYKLIYVERVSVNHGLILWLKTLLLLNKEVVRDDILIIRIVSIPLLSELNIISKLFYKFTSLAFRSMYLGSDTDLIIGCGHPRDYTMVDSISADLKYYDCMDNRAALASYSQNGRSPETVNRLEKEIEEVADILILSSKTLKELFRERTPYYIVNNGVNTDGFSDQKPILNYDIPEGRPLIGYVGAIRDWLDYELLTQTAQQRPEYDFIFVGGREKLNQDISELEVLENTRFLGQIPYTDVASVILTFDVCLIPFELNELTRFVDPIKKYEYLAAGKPILSSNLYDVSRHNHPSIKTYSNVNDFLDKLDALVQYSKDDDELKQLAAKNTWEQRAQKVMDIIEKNA